MLTADGEVLNVARVELELLEEPVRVYNFEVADWHTYYVSEEEVLVHNDCMAGGNRNSVASPYDLIPTHSQTKSKSKMKEFINEIKNNGIEDTIKYVKYNEQKYIVDGHHRVIAAKKLGIKEVPIEQVQLPYAGYKTIEDLLWMD